MKIGDKLKEGYEALIQNDIEGAFILFSVAGELYILDKLDQELFNMIKEYTASIDMKSFDLEPNDYLKHFLKDKRYTSLLKESQDILSALVLKFNEYEEIPERVIFQSFLEGDIEKLKYDDGHFFCIYKNGEGKTDFLIRIDDKGEVPIDFDVKDFELNREDKKIHYSYKRGYKTEFSINYDGTDKKVINKNI